MKRIGKISLLVVLLMLFNESYISFVSASYQSGFCHCLNSIATNNKVDVTVGESGTIYLSNDGDKWIKEISNTDKNLSKIIYGKGTFIAVGEKGTVISSADGIRWSKINLNTSENLKNIRYINNKYIILAKNKIYISDNSVKWKTIKTATDFSKITEMISFKGRYIGIMNNYILSSSVLSNWKMIKKSGNFNSITTDGKIVVAAGNYITNSSDGLNWSYEFKYDPKKIFNLVKISKAYLEVGGDAIVKLSICSLKYVNKRFVAILNATSNDAVWGGYLISITSKNGYNWTANVLECLESNTGYSNIIFICNNIGQQMAINYATRPESLSPLGNEIVISNDGITWNRIMAAGYNDYIPKSGESPSQANMLYLSKYSVFTSFSDMIWDGKNFILVGENLVGKNCCIVKVKDQKFYFIKMLQL